MNVDNKFLFMKMVSEGASVKKLSRVFNLSPRMILYHKRKLKEGIFVSKSLDYLYKKNGISDNIVNINQDIINKTIVDNTNANEAIVDKTIVDESIVNEAIVDKTVDNEAIVDKVNDFVYDPDEPLGLTVKKFIQRSLKRGFKDERVEAMVITELVKLVAALDK